LDKSLLVLITSCSRHWKAPRGGRLSTGRGSSPGIWGSIGSGVCGSRMTCLGPGREGMGITSQGRDARGLTFSAVIPARVMQPEVSTRGKQNWRIALCNYGMTFAQRHRVHLLCVASLAHLRCAHRLGCSLAGLWWRVRVGLAPGPPLNFKVRPFSAGGGPLECLFPYHQKPGQRNASEAEHSFPGVCSADSSLHWANGFADCCIRTAT
jgi:hypothetical protein